MAGRLDFDGIGTRWRIDTPRPLPSLLVDELLARVERFDHDWSRFRSDSLVAEIARSPGRYRLPDDAGPMLDWYRALHDATDGAVSPLVGASLERLGYGAGHRLRASADPAPAPEWARTISWDGEWLETSAPVTIDVGAVGKGLLVDLLGGMLDAAGIREHLVDGSGDLAHRGGDSVRIALEHPLDPALAVGVVELRDAALCASASNRRRWGPALHHIIDATTGRPVEQVIASWVVADSAMIADGLATALFTTAPERLAAFDAQWVRMSASGRIETSEHFEGELFV